jgi:hypothetical protein
MGALPFIIAPSIHKKTDIRGNNWKLKRKLYVYEPLQIIAARNNVSGFLYEEDNAK